MIYFGIDYGDTTGFSIIDDQGFVILLGSHGDPQVCIDLLDTSIKYHSEISVVIEKQIGVKTERFTNFIEKVNLLCSLSSTKIIEVLPHIWKKSFINKTKIKVSNHASDSAKIAIYGLYKQSKE